MPRLDVLNTEGSFRKRRQMYEILLMIISLEAGV